MMLRGYALGMEGDFGVIVNWWMRYGSKVQTMSKRYCAVTEGNCLVV